MIGLEQLWPAGIRLCELDTTNLQSITALNRPPTEHGRNLFSIQAAAVLELDLRTRAYRQKMDGLTEQLVG
ncbi:hypothetical protein ACFLZ1_03365 [Patescibacteria group bacterium]